MVIWTYYSFLALNKNSILFLATITTVSNQNPTFKILNYSCFYPYPRPQRLTTSMRASSCVLERESSMGATGWPTAWSTPPLLPLSPRSEHRPRVAPDSRRYASGRPMDRPRSRHYRLVLVYSSCITRGFPCRFTNITFATMYRLRWKLRTRGPTSWRRLWLQSGRRDWQVTRGCRTCWRFCRVLWVLLCHPAWWVHLSLLPSFLPSLLSTLLRWVIYIIHACYLAI